MMDGKEKNDLWIECSSEPAFMSSYQAHRDIAGSIGRARLHPQPIKEYETFLESYNDPKARAARFRAYCGSVKIDNKRVKLRKLLLGTLGLHESGQPEQEKNEAIKELAFQAYENGDSALLELLAKVGRWKRDGQGFADLFFPFMGGVPFHYTVDHEKGPAGHHARIMKAFLGLCRKNERLPTKADLREVVEDSYPRKPLGKLWRRDFTEYQNKLGLQGLPQRD